MSLSYDDLKKLFSEGTATHRLATSTVICILLILAPIILTPIGYYIFDPDKGGDVTFMGLSGGCIMGLIVFAGAFAFIQLMIMSMRGCVVCSKNLYTSFGEVSREIEELSASKLVEKCPVSNV